MESGLLCLASFTKNNVVRLHPCCVTHQYFVPFHSWLGFHCRDICAIFCNSWSTFGLFLFFNYHEEATMNIYTQVLVWTHVSDSPGCAWKSGMAGSLLFQGLWLAHCLLSVESLWSHRPCLWRLSLTQTSSPLSSQYLYHNSGWIDIIC